MVLADGRRAFFKGIYQASNEFSRNALLHEERVYRDLGNTLGKWMPRWYATIHSGDWHILLLEDLGPKSVPPWTPGKARAIAHALAAFHLSSSGTQAPAWLMQPEEELAEENWTRTAQQSQGFQHLAALAGDQASLALAWFEQISPTVEHWMKQSVLLEGPHSILHGDLRSDNLRFSQGRLYLFDWPAITVGRPEWDIVAFAQSVTVEGGPSPEQVMSWYGERFPLRTVVVDCALAWWLTFFADRAWRPEIPGLPRVRHFQRQQLGVLASWVARQWSFPQPTWIERLIEASERKTDSLAGPEDASHLY